MQCTAEKGAVERAIMIRPEKALKRRLCKGRIKEKRGKRTVEGVLQKFLALYGVITLL